MSTIAIEDVSKVFGDKTALDGVCLEIKSGELVAILGSSGCGKTTLLRVIAGLTSPDYGRVLFNDRDVTDVPTRLRPIGAVLQGSQLFPHMTVRENIAFPLMVRGLGYDAVRQRVDELLDMMDLAAWARHHPNELSGGQQQKTALARALAPRPSVLLLDEPLSALDAVVRIHLRDEIRRIQQQIKTTALLVTHDQSEALAVADRVVVMRGGRIEQIAAPPILYESPATEFTAAFVGNRNLMNLPVRGGHIRAGRSLDISTDLKTTRAIVFVRCEDVRRADVVSGQPALIENRIFQGATTRFYLVLETEEGPLRLRADWPSREAAHLQTGEFVPIAITPRDALVFPG